MKKFFLVLASLVFASSAFAQETKTEGPSFKYNVFAESMMYTDQSAAESKQNGTTLRVRPKFTASMGNVSVVTYFEIDAVAGGDSNTVSTDGYIAHGADNKGMFELKNAYIDIKDAIIPGLGIKSGVYEYRFPIAIIDDYFGGQISYNAGIAKVTFDYIKLQEDALVEDTATTSDADDAQIYAGKVDLKLGAMTITPAFLYQKYEKQSTITATSYYGTAKAAALTFAMKQGPLDILVDGVYVTGRNHTDKADIKAYAADFKLGFKVMPMLTVEAFGLYATGSDDTDDTEFSSQLGEENELEAGQLFMINDAGYYTHTVKNSGEFDKASKSDGLMVFGLAFKAKVDKLSLVAQIGYAQCTSDKEGVSDKGIGTEYDLRIGYGVAPKTELFVEGAYLSAGKYVESTVGDKNPFYYGVGLKTSI